MSTDTMPTVAYELDTARIEFVQQTLLDWFAANGRDLPWRRTRDPYHILVSEVMLQQIQVTRAIPFYVAFIARFPTVRSLAESPIAEVIRVWGDLGRYRRIGYLHGAAREIFDRFDGIVPSDIETLKTLPGVGPYTAGAVACFAYEQDVGFVDTNVRRVISRIFAGSSVHSEREIADFAGRLVPNGRGWDWNQGLLDFGALQCVVRKPKCATCPLQAVCDAYPVSSDPAPRQSTEAKPFAESNRYYRGRVLATLRDQGDHETIPLTSLGANIKTAFGQDDLPWLYGIVTGLAKDGLAHLAEASPGYDAEGDGPPLADLAVRLP